ERKGRPADEEGQANQPEDGRELLARDEEQGQLERHSFTPAVKIDTIGFSAVLKAPCVRTEHRASLVAIDRQQPVSELHAPSRRSRVVDFGNKPTRAVRSKCPAGGFFETVVAGIRVDGEREQADVQPTDEEHEPEESRSTVLITH